MDNWVKSEYMGYFYIMFLIEKSTHILQILRNWTIDINYSWFGSLDLILIPFFIVS